MFSFVSIEHLFPETEINVPNNIFGCIKPKLAIVTTPNSDFNVLFGAPKYPNGFRHDDHKFEWDRMQFQDWYVYTYRITLEHSTIHLHCRAWNVCQRYPEYKVFICGVGEGPVGREHVGKCSQLACFVHKDLWDEMPSPFDNTRQRSTSSTKPLTMPIYITAYDYHLIHHREFPFDVELRSHDEIVVDEFKYFVNRYISFYDQYYDDEKKMYTFPLGEVFGSINGVANVKELRDILQEHKYNINANDEVVIEPISDENDFSEA